MKLAEAYGIWATRVSDPAQVTEAIRDAMAVDGPTLIDFDVARDENVYPHLPAGGTASQMLEGPTGKDEPAWLT